VGAQPLEVRQAAGGLTVRLARSELRRFAALFHGGGRRRALLRCPRGVALLQCGSYNFASSLPCGPAQLAGRSVGSLFLKNLQPIGVGAWMSWRSGVVSRE
jgi:hypothetical protein